MSEKIKDYQINGRRPFFILAFVIGLASVGIYCALLSVGFWIVGQLFIAIAMYQSFVILHDCGHQIFFSSKPLNRIVGVFASILCLIPFYPWMLMHRIHHKWTGWADMDPLTEHIIPKSAMTRFLVNICWKYGLPVFAFFYVIKTHYNLFFVFRHVVSLENRIKCILSILLIPGCWGLAFFLMGSLFLKVFLGAFVILQVLSDLILISNHACIPKRFTGKDVRGPLPTDMHGEYSRNIRFPRWIEKWVFLYSNRHADHHQNPQVPCYQYQYIDAPQSHDIGFLQWIRLSKKLSGIDVIYNHDDPTVI